MRFLPYEDFYIGTRLTYHDLNKRLQMLTDTSFHLFEPFSSRKQYYGWITLDGFRIHHWISHQSYLYHPMFFPPVIAGNFLKATNGEVIIRMKLYLHWTALIGLLLWLLVYSLLFIIPLILIFPDATHIPGYAQLIFSFFYVLILICTYGTTLALFERQARQEKEYFRKLTAAYEVVERY